MKKGVCWVLFVIVGALLVSAFASAISYKCSDGSAVSSDLKEIGEGEKKTIEGIGIGVIMGDEAVSKLRADILVEAYSLSLMNTTDNPQEITFGDTTYDILLKSATSDSATLRIDSSDMTMNRGDVNMSGNLIIFLYSSGATQEEGGKAKVLIGKQRFMLSNYDNPSQKVSVGDKDYYVELNSASDSGATIKVSACSSGDISQIAEPNQVNASVEVNTSAQNSSVNASVNSSVGANIHPNTSLNASANASSGITLQGEQKIGFFGRIWGWIKGLFGK